MRVAPGPRFGVDGTMERFLRLPFTLPEADLVEAVRRLAAARADLDRPAGTPGRPRSSSPDPGRRRPSRPATRMSRPVRP